MGLLEIPVEGNLVVGILVEDNPVVGMRLVEDIPAVGIRLEEDILVVDSRLVVGMELGLVVGVSN